jgi:hypothetical protein
VQAAAQQQSWLAEPAMCPLALDRHICQPGAHSRSALPSTPIVLARSFPLRRPLQLAEGEPPRVNIASFRLLFMIVRDDPPQLEGGSWSTEFKDFVWQCLQKVRCTAVNVLLLLLLPTVHLSSRGLSCRLPAVVTAVVTAPASCCDVCGSGWGCWW